MEHRAHQRAPLTGAVKFFEWNKALQAEALEISAGGIFLRTKEVLAEGAMVTLRVTLPGLRQAFTVLGKVVRTVKGGLFNQPGMGVRFVDLKPAERSVISSYVMARQPRLAGGVA